MNQIDSRTQNIPAAILAGGLGVRLRPLTETRPKVMVDIEGKPFIHYLLEMLRRRGVCRVVLCVGYCGEQIEAYVGNGAWLGLQVEYAYDDPSGDRVPCGTANAIRGALHKLDRSFWVINGDTYLDMDYDAVRECYQLRHSTNLVVVYKNENRHWPSNATVVDGKITSYNKEVRGSRMDHVDAGVAMLRAATFEVEDKVSALSALYARLAARRQLGAFEVDRRFYEINTPASLEQTSQFLRENHLPFSP